jgi:predicted O-methyltransferase YrrM/glycosyltransferase involved in cell wall biosynthesis
MRISTIVLNWNRETLLEQCLQSYAATIDEPFQLVLIDNASGDGSREVIERFYTELSYLKPIFLDQNLGGEAINLALEQATGDLIHISENDQIYLPGWSQHVRECFRVFTGLRQLSLHGVVPTDDEVWELKPAHLRFSKGKIVYEAQGNVGTSSVILGDAFRKGGIRLHNISPEDGEKLKFPDDARLSADIKKLGLLCAWSDRYYVRNLGHEYSEFGRDPDYYRKNYESKLWLRMEGFKKRLEAARSRPRVHRHSIIFPAAKLQAEKTPGEVAGKSSQLWSMFDGFTAETEVLDFLYTLVRLVKPERAIETGTWLGRSAVAIGLALRDNGFGKLVSLEVDPEAAKCALTEIETAGLRDWVEVVIEQSLTFEPPNQLEFALLDSDIGVRAHEFRHLYEKLVAGATVVFHDTGAQHPGLAEGIKELISQGRLVGSFFSTPRGIFVGSVRRPPKVPDSSFDRPLSNLQKAAVKPSGERAAILILGMHRSGTSALARVLSLLGGELPEGLLAPGCGNTLGYWESKRLMEIDDEILLAVGRTWDDPRQIRSAWFRSRTTYTFHERLREVIVSEYGDAPLIVIKEPRICRLAPLYLDVLDALGMRPYVVLPVRHPVEVIRSVRERDCLDPATIELLWLRHVLEAETASRSCRRVWTRYDQLLRSWEATVQSIARGLDITWPNEPEHVRPMIDEFLRPRHRHHQIDKDPNSPLLGHLTTRAWEAVQHALDGNEAAAQMIFDEINRTLEEVDRMSFPSEEAAQRQLLALEAERDDLRDSLAKCQASLSEVSGRLSTLEAERSDLRNGLAKCQASLSEVRAHLAQADEKHAQLQTSRDEVAGVLEASERKLKLANDQISSLKNAVEGLNGRISSMLGSRSWRMTAPLRVLQRWILGR